MKKALLATLAIAAIVVPAAAATPPDTADGHKVTICHHTASATNPVVIITVDRASFDDRPGTGHTPPHHQGDNGGPDGEVYEQYCDPKNGGGGGRGE